MMMTVLLAGPPLPPKIKSSRLLGSLALTIRPKSIRFLREEIIVSNRHTTNDDDDDDDDDPSSHPQPIKWICRIQFWGEDGFVDVDFDFDVDDSTNTASNINSKLDDDSDDDHHVSNACSSGTSSRVVRVVEYPLLGSLQGLEEYFADMGVLLMPVIQRRRRMAVKAGTEAAVDSDCEQRNHWDDKYVGLMNLSMRDVFRELIHEDNNVNVTQRRNRTFSSTKQFSVPILSMPKTQVQSQKVGGDGDDDGGGGILPSQQKILLGEMEITFMLRIHDCCWQEATTTTVAANMIGAEESSSSMMEEGMTGGAEHGHHVVPHIHRTRSKNSRQGGGSTLPPRQMMSSRENDSDVKATIDPMLHDYHETMGMKLLLHSEFLGGDDDDDDDMEFSMATEDDSILLDAVLGSHWIRNKQHTRSLSAIERQRHCATTEHTIAYSTRSMLQKTSLPDFQLNLQRDLYPSMWDMSDDKCHKILDVRFGKFTIEDVTLSPSISESSMDLTSSVSNDGCRIVEYMIQFKAPPVVVLPLNEIEMKTVMIYHKEEETTRTRRRGTISKRHSRMIQNGPRKGATNSKKDEEVEVKAMIRQRCHKVRHESLWHIRFEDDEGIKSWMEETWVIHLVAKSSSSKLETIRGARKKNSIVGGTNNSSSVPKHRSSMSSSASTSSSCEKTLVLAKATIRLCEVLSHQDLRLKTELPFRCIKKGMKCGSISVQLELLPSQNKCTTRSLNSASLKMVEEEVGNLISEAQCSDSFDFSEEDTILSKNSHAQSPSPQEMNIVQDERPNDSSTGTSEKDVVGGDLQHLPSKAAGDRQHTEDLVIMQQKHLNNLKVTTDGQSPSSKVRASRERTEELSSLSSPPLSVHPLWMCVVVSNISCISMQYMMKHLSIYLKLSCDDVSGGLFVTPRVYNHGENQNDNCTEVCTWITPLDDCKDNKIDSTRNRHVTIRIEIWRCHRSNIKEEEIMRQQSSSHSGDDDPCDDFLGAFFIPINLPRKNDVDSNCYESYDDTIFTQDRLSKRQMHVAVGVGRHDQVYNFAKRAKSMKAIQTWLIRNHRLQKLKKDMAQSEKKKRVETEIGMNNIDPLLHKSKDRHRNAVVIQRFWGGIQRRRKLVSVSDIQKIDVSRPTPRSGGNESVLGGGTDVTHSGARRKKLYIKFGKSSGIREIVALWADNNPSEGGGDPFACEVDLPSSSGILITFSILAVSENETRPRIHHFSSAITRMTAINRHVTNLNYEFDMYVVEMNETSWAKHEKSLECCLWFVPTVTDIMSGKFPVHSTKESIVPPMARKIGSANCPLDTLTSRVGSVCYDCPWIMKLSPSCEDLETIGHVQIMIDHKKKKNLKNIPVIKIHCQKTKKDMRAFDWELPDNIESLMSQQKVKGRTIAAKDNTDASLHVDPNETNLCSVDRPEKQEINHLPLDKIAPEPIENLSEAKGHNMADLKVRNAACLKDSGTGPAPASDAKNVDIFKHTTKSDENTISLGHKGGNIQRSKCNIMHKVSGSPGIGTSVVSEERKDVPSKGTESLACQISTALMPRRKVESKACTAHISRKEEKFLRQFNQNHSLGLQASSGKHYPQAESKSSSPRYNMSKERFDESKSYICDSFDDASSEAHMTVKNLEVPPNSDDESSCCSFASSLKMRVAQKQSQPNSTFSSSSSSGMLSPDMKSNKSLHPSTMSCEESFDSASSSGSSFSSPAKLRMIDKTPFPKPLSPNGAYFTSSSSSSDSSNYS